MELDTTMNEKTIESPSPVLEHRAPYYDYDQEAYEPHDHEDWFEDATFTEDDNADISEFLNLIGQ